MKNLYKLFSVALLVIGFGFIVAPVSAQSWGGGYSSSYYSVPYYGYNNGYYNNYNSNYYGYRPMSSYNYNYNYGGYNSYRGYPNNYSYYSSTYYGYGNNYGYNNGHVGYYGYCNLGGC